MRAIGLPSALVAALIVVRGGGSERDRQAGGDAASRREKNKNDENSPHRPTPESARRSPTPLVRPRRSGPSSRGERFIIDCLSRSPRCGFNSSHGLPKLPRFAAADLVDETLQPIGRAHHGAHLAVVAVEAEDGHSLRILGVERLVAGR